MIGWALPILCLAYCGVGGVGGELVGAWNIV